MARPRGSRRLLALWAVATLLVTGLLYAGHLEGDWFFDDHVTVLANDRIERLWPPTWAWFEEDTPLASRPAVAFTVAADFALHGTSPRGYRRSNLALHLASSLLLLWLVWSLLSLETWLRTFFQK